MAAVQGGSPGTRALSVSPTLLCQVLSLCGWLLSAPLGLMHDSKVGRKGLESLGSRSSCLGLPVAETVDHCIQLQGNLLLSRRKETVS